MKRKRRVISGVSLIDSLLTLAPTLEAIESSHDEILGARDFSGVPYHIYTTKNTLRFDFDTIRYMVTSRQTFTGRRSFVGVDGRLLAVDVYKAEHPHTIWSYTGGLFQNLTEKC